jgi:hypothetical protein
MDADQGISLVSHGDQLEQDTWTKLEPYLSKYEVVWRMLVVPLRDTGSVYLRSDIDADLETFAMNNYTAYVNMSRALDKIESNADDLKFAEEIWANLKRTVEVAKKAEAAFSKVYVECTRTDAGINTQQLDSAEASVKIYRNRLHDPIPATLKDEHGIRLIPKRDKLEKYSHWTKAMYDHDLSDFEPVASQLRDDFSRVCSSLQDLWTQIERLSEDLLRNERYKIRSGAPSLQGAVPIGLTNLGSMINQNSASPSITIPIINRDSTSGSISASDYFPHGSKSELPE